MVLLKYFLEAALSACAYGIICFGWWRTLQHRRNASGGGANFTLLLAGALMWTQIFCVILVLGLAGILYGSLVLCINAGITVTLLWLARHGPREPRKPSVRNPIDWLSVALVALGGIAFAWFAVLNIAYPTGAYDDFVYHVPTAAYFVQSHSIQIFHVAPVQDGINTAAKLGELFSVWQFFLTLSDRLIDFWALGLFVQYLIAVYGLCRELGSSARGALFGTVLSAFAPVLLFQTLSSQNDLPMCAFFATALRFAVASSRGWLQRIAVGISSGLLLSSKLSGGVLVAIVIAGFVVAEAGRTRRVGFGEMAKSIAVIALIAAVLGGWWYVRNYRVYRSPFYPFEAKLAGIRFPGPISNSAEMFMLNPEYSALPVPVRLWRLWREEKSHYGLWLYNSDSAYAGFGPVCFVLGLPSLAMAFAFSLLDRNWVAASVLLMIAGVYLAFAGNISPRLSLFILPAVAVAIALMLTAIDQASAPFGVVVRLLGIGLVSYTFLAAAMSPLNPVSIRDQLFKSPQEKDLAHDTFLTAFSAVRTAIPARAAVAYDQSTLFLWPLWRPDWNNEVQFVPTTAGWEAWRVRAASLGITHVAVGRSATSNTRASNMVEWVRLHGEHFQLVAKGWSGALYAYHQ